VVAVTAELALDPEAVAPGARRLGRARRLAEAALFVAVYLSYDTARNLVAGSPRAAFHNARSVIGLERGLHLYHEAAVQRVLVGHRGFVWLLDGYYGWVHFAVPIVVAIALLASGDARRWLRWRNTFWLLCGLALVGFWLFPLAPPRLVPGGGFVDTMLTVGGPGISTRSAASVGNAFAAMPSLHAGWSLWAAGAAMPLVRRRWARGVLLLHPAITVVVIVVTANHYVVDALAGWACHGHAYLVAGWLTGDLRTPGRAPASA
jgi:hypothetical protein